MAAEPVRLCDSPIRLRQVGLVRQVSPTRCIKTELNSWDTLIVRCVRPQVSSMFQLLLLAGLVAGGYILLTQTLFKKSRCKGNAAVAGKTVIITGERVCLQQQQRHYWSSSEITEAFLLNICAKILIICLNELRKDARITLHTQKQNQGKTCRLNVRINKNLYNKSWNNFPLVTYEGKTQILPQPPSAFLFYGIKIKYLQLLIRKTFTGVTSSLYWHFID